jgi:hypothetical protein
LRASRRFLRTLTDELRRLNYYCHI